MKKIFKRIRTFFYTSICARNISHGGNLHINKYCKFVGRVCVGYNCHFNGMKFVGGSLTIGDNFHSGEDILILAQNHNYQGKALPYDDTFINKDVVISDNVWIGSRVLICGQVSIGEGAIIAAGSVITKNIPPFAIMGGNKILKYRDIAHYNRLKELKAFH